MKIYHMCDTCHTVHATEHIDGPDYVVEKMLSRTPRTTGRCPKKGCGGFVYRVKEDEIQQLKKLKAKSQRSWLERLFNRKK